MCACAAAQGGLKTAASRLLATSPAERCSERRRAPPHLFEFDASVCVSCAARRGRRHAQLGASMDDLNLARSRFQRLGAACSIDAF